MAYNFKIQNVVIVLLGILHQININGFTTAHQKDLFKKKKHHQISSFTVWNSNKQIMDRNLFISYRHCKALQPIRLLFFDVICEFFQILFD